MQSSTANTLAALKHVVPKLLEASFLNRGVIHKHFRPTESAAKELRSHL